MQLGKREQGDGRAARGRDGARRFLVLADLGGRQSRDVLEPGDGLAARALIRVRQESFDAAVAAVAPRLALPAAFVGAAGPPREITCLAELHPDTLFRRLAIFRDPPRAPVAAGVVPVREVDADDVARLLGRRPAAPAAAEPRRGPTAVVDALIGQIFNAGVADAGPRPEAPLDAGTLGRTMRAVLRDPGLQAHEASWRALELLVSRVDEETEIWLLDVSRAELAVDLLGSDGASAVAGGDTDAAARARVTAVEASGLARRLLAAPGGRRWAAVIADFAFGPGAMDIALLERLGALSARLGAPCLAGAAPALVGCRSLEGQADPARWPALASEDAARWRALRRGPDAAWLGLALPRFLCRAPYGAKTGPIDAFPFEEIGDRPEADALPWASSAFLAALVLSRTMAAGDAADDGDGDGGEIDDLPYFSFRAEGEVEMYPTAEAFWGQRAADAALARGLMPVLSVRDRNAVRLVRLQSIADPPGALGDTASGDRG